MLSFPYMMICASYPTTVAKTFKIMLDDIVTVGNLILFFLSIYQCFLAGWTQTQDRYTTILQNYA